MCDGVFYSACVEECLLRLVSNKRPMWGLNNPPFFLIHFSSRCNRTIIYRSNHLRLPKHVLWSGATRAGDCHQLDGPVRIYLERDVFDAEFEHA